MKPSDHDHPDLTAYVLGELNSVESARVRQLLAQSPEARVEHQRITQMVAALHEQAPAIPRRSLNPRQRETILAMGQPRTSANPGRDHARRIAWGVAKLAAAASVTAGAFALGMKYADRLEDVAKLAATSTPSVQVKNTGATPTPEVAANTPEKNALVASAGSVSPTVKTVAAAISDKTEVAVAPHLPLPTPVASGTGAVAVASAKPETPVAQAAVAPMAPAPKAPSLVASNSLKAFTLVKTQPEASFLLQPKLVRPKIQSAEFAGLTVAAPLLERPKNAPKAPAAPRKPEPQPALVVHSLDVKVASCPWDPSRRLVRLVTQVPVDQAAIDVNEQDYRMQVKFDPAQVQGYRLIMEKHTPPTGGSNLATRFAWYEIVPTKNYSPTHDKPVALGVMEIAQPRGTPANVSSASQKQLVDQGKDWNEWGEAYTFETAMVGFKLLLQGSEDIGSLNHKLVLDLAQQSKGDDANGERTKFIHVVQQAQRAAGL